MWIVAPYQSVTFFSLKPAGATSSGGKTLLIPTPFAIKMALLNAAIHLYSRAEGERLFPFLRDLDLSLEPPENILVMKSFSKIRRILKDKNNLEKAQKAREKKEYPLQSTIAYREYVNYQGGILRLACQLTDQNPLLAVLPELLLQINYLGKRGGFLQITEPPHISAELPSGHFIHLTATVLQDFSIDGTLQMLDDCGSSLTFAKADISNETKIVLHKDRILRHIVLPYRPIRTSHNYSWYQHI